MEVIVAILLIVLYVWLISLFFVYLYPWLAIAGAARGPSLRTRTPPRLQPPAASLLGL